MGDIDIVKEDKNLFCFILAGGEGSRLKNLTKDTCKPLVKVCCVYHLIDFTLINCLRSGIIDMAIIVQYESIDLIKYLYKSNMNSLMRNFYVLPPEIKKSHKEYIGYKDTAHSVYVNKNFIDDSIDDILILSADHIYSMDYTKFHNHHIENDNDLTISVLNVPIEDASRYGVFTVDEEDNILDFEEKPENPKSSIASMGIYIFKKELLFNVLDELYKIKGPNLDFGRDVIPYYLKHHKVGIYKFKWYWIDLGTLNSFWKLNMGFLDNTDEIQKFFHFDERFKISTDASNLYPAILGSHSNIRCSLMGKNSYVDGELFHSMVGDNCRIDKNTTIIKSVIMDNCHIKEGVTIVNAVISQNTIVEEDVVSNGEDIICI